MRNIITWVVVVLFATSCQQGKDNPEQAALPLLNAARTEMIKKNYQAARDSIIRLRQSFPTAFQSRMAALLLMDSIELSAAKDSLTILDALVQEERNKLETICNRQDALKQDEYYDQKNKVFYMEQHLDEVAAKVKFYIRKIDIDKNKIQTKAG